MKFSQRKVILWLGLIILLLTACTTSASQPTETVNPTNEVDGIILKDDLGKSIEFDKPAMRVVTLGPSTVESLFAIGAGSQIVGREEYSLYPPEAESIPSIGSLFGNLPSEAILALEPDLIIAPEIISSEQVQALEELGLVVFYQKNPTTFDQLYQNLRELGVLVGRENEADTLVTQLQDRVQVVKDQLTGVEMRPRVFYELDATEPENPYTTGAGTFIDTLIQMAGGENVGAVLDGEYAQISSEQIILADPEIILLADAVFGITPEILAARPGWEKLSAVQGGKVFPFDPNLGSVPGPRMVDGLEIMALLIHPEAFEK